MAKNKNPVDSSEQKSQGKTPIASKKSNAIKSKPKTQNTIVKNTTAKSATKKNSRNDENISDSHGKRESQKYSHPIASREFILEKLLENKHPLTFNEILNSLSVAQDDEEQSIAIKRRLRAMVRDGQIIQTRNGTFGLAAKMELIKGRVSANSGGFGFLIPEDGSDDLFLSPGQMKALFDGDIILAKVSGVDRRGRKEGRVEDILERNTQEVVGRCYFESGIRFLKAESKKIIQDIIIAESENIHTTDGQFVVLEIIKQPDYRSPAVGRIIEVLGEHMAPGMEIDVAIRSHQLPHRWPHEVDVELDRIPTIIKNSEIKNRVDLREKNFVTIDGEDARDFDDAIFCEKQNEGWNLTVAIADVAHYVESNSALDLEALNRGNSIYFPKRVIPMLPEKLSNGLCSLNPAQDRLTLAVEMKVNGKGELMSYRFMESCIHSKARLTYTEVAKFLDEGEVSKALLPVTEDILAFYKLYQVLKTQRDKRGAINVESIESRFIFNEDKKIEAVVPVIRNVAHQMIEEAMLLANICAAKILQENSLPALYRVHDAPSEEKINTLKEYLQPLGFKFSTSKSSSPSKSGKITSAHFQEAVAFSKGRPDQELINTIVLRSMQQAIYSPECSEHFGLAYEEYAHFTSPIRRYPDLIVHRALKYLIRSDAKSKSVIHIKGATPLTRNQMLIDNASLLNERAQHVSFTERRADLASRDATDWLKCEFMLDKVGETFTGKISSVTGFGLFVMLNDIFIEGLVHISELKSDYYHFDERRHELKGEQSQKVFRLADVVTVQVARVSLDDKKIEFILLGDDGAHVDQKSQRKPYADGKSYKNNTKQTASKNFDKNDSSGKKTKKPSNKKRLENKKPTIHQAANQTTKQMPKKAAKPKNRSALGSGSKKKKPKRKLNAKGAE